MCSSSNVSDIVVRHKLWCVVPNKFLIECLILLLLCNGDRYRVSIQIVFIGMKPDTVGSFLMLCVSGLVRCYNGGF